MVSLFYKFKMPKRCENHSTRTLDLLCAKNRSKKHPHNIREMTLFWKSAILNALARASAIAFAKWSVWVKSWKCQKDAKNHSTRPIEFFCAKNCLKNTKYSRNKTIWKNRASCKGYIPVKRHSLWRIVSFAQNLKMTKACKKHFSKNIEYLCAKNSWKNY